ncbi:general stress protein [Streptomyces naganishii]|nr:general stress protein [Streptomyces naganishii]
MTEQARRAVASFATYQEAERAVDHLADQGFPVQKVAIIGRDVRPAARRSSRRLRRAALLWLSNR